MIFRTVVRDCLYLHWALPVEWLPPLEPPLVYDTVAGEGGDVSFVSVVLFRLSGLHLQSLPAVRLSHPQLLARHCVRDADGLPAFLLRRVLMPAWVLPAARLVARQPARRGGFRFPRGAAASDEPGSWEVWRRGRLRLYAAPGSAARAAGPDLGSWERTVRYFQRRRVSYFATSSGLRRVSVPTRLAEPLPMRVELAQTDLLPSCFGVHREDEWPPLHSAWLAPEESFLFEVGAVSDAPLRRQLPAPG